MHRSESFIEEIHRCGGRVNHMSLSIPIGAAVEYVDNPGSEIPIGKVIGLTGRFVVVMVDGHVDSWELSSVAPLGWVNRTGYWDEERSDVRDDRYNDFYPLVETLAELRHVRRFSLADNDAMDAAIANIEQRIAKHCSDIFNEPAPITAE